jgi:hypothetical protein
MLDQSFLRERFEDLLTHQEAALGHYESAASEETDPQARTHLEDILRDKKRHVELTRRLLEIVE